MAIRIIPLQAGVAYQSFTVTLDRITVRFKISWLTQFGYFIVDMYNGEDPIALGRALHPGLNLLDGLNIKLGSIALDGKAPTPSNLGVDNKLQYTGLSS